MLKLDLKKYLLIALGDSDFSPRCNRHILTSTTHHSPALANCLLLPAQFKVPCICGWLTTGFSAATLRIIWNSAPFPVRWRLPH